MYDGESTSKFVLSLEIRFSRHAHPLNLDLVRLCLSFRALLRLRHGKAELNHIECRLYPKQYRLLLKWCMHIPMAYKAEVFHDCMIAGLRP